MNAAPSLKADAVEQTAYQRTLDITPEILVDLFAGGGGVSEGVEMALGFPPHVAVNHNDHALSMHRMNHPFTRHHIADVFDICPKGVIEFHRRPVGALHLSPDCTHHSQASGGQPRDRKIRALSWVAVRWAGQVKPRVITLENVKQILKWGPLIAKRDKATGRVIKLVTETVNGKKKTRQVVAEPGERVLLQQQFLMPDPKRAGQTWQRFVRILEGMGYQIETRKIVAADLGAGTTRERLYMIGRCDGQPIVWPMPTRVKTPAKGQKRWKPASDSIDWGIPCPSIFERKRPLAPATMKRIAKGMKRYVLDSADPFIVPIAHYNGSEPVHSVREPLRTVTAFPKGGTFAVVAPTIVPATHQGDHRVHDPKEPLPTITAAHRGELMACAATLIQAAHGDGQPGRAQRWSEGCRDIQEPIGTITASGGHAIAAATLVQTGYGEREGQAPRCMDIDHPLGTLVGTGKHALASAYLMQANGGFCTTPGHDARKPMSTITNSGSQQQVVTAFLSSYYTDDSDRCRSPEEPVPTVTTANRVGLVAAHLAHLRGNCDARDMDAPLHTVSAGGQHHALVEYWLSPEDEAGALRVADFIMGHYREDGQLSDEGNNPLNVKERLAQVTVMIQGTPYVIVDIGLRMLTPRELYRAQGFRESYIIDIGHDGRKFTKEQQVRMVGNSVPPDVIAAIYLANLGELALRKVA